MDLRCGPRWLARLTPRAKKDPFHMKFEWPCLVIVVMHKTKLICQKINIKSLLPNKNKPHGRLMLGYHGNREVVAR